MAANEYSLPQQGGAGEASGGHAGASVGRRSGAVWPVDAKPIAISIEDDATPDVATAGPVVETDRLVLRSLQPTDREAYLSLVESSREHLQQWIPLEEVGETSDAYFDRQVAYAADGDAKSGAWRRVGIMKDGPEAGQIVGCFHLNAISRGLEWEADAAWWVGAQFTRQGLAMEGAKAMLQHAFDPLGIGLGLHAVHAGIEPENNASRSMALKLGFEHIQSKRSHIKVGDRWAMHEFYLITPDAVG